METRSTLTTSIQHSTESPSRSKKTTNVCCNSTRRELGPAMYHCRSQFTFHPYLFWEEEQFTHTKPTNSYFCPGWCGSVDWVLAWEPKVRWFDSQSEHMPGLQDRSPVGGAWEATPFSLPSPLKINKNILKKEETCFWPLLFICTVGSDWEKQNKKYFLSVFLSQAKMLVPVRKNKFSFSPQCLDQCLG